MSTHTPGPWTQVGTKTIWENHGFKVYAFPIQGSGQAIAAVWAGSVGKEAFGFDNQEANARLIAAAPDLLAALTEIAETAENNTVLIPEKVAAFARAAIAKAEGVR